MRYVLDTHALLWHLSNDARLGANAKRILDDPGREDILILTNDIAIVQSGLVSVVW